MSKKLHLITINSILFLSTVYISIYRIFNGASAGQVGESMFGIGYFKAFTNLSNILNGIFALVSLIFIFINIKDKDYKLNNIVIKLQYISGCAVFLTFTTVVLFLAPMLYFSWGLDFMNLFTHDMFHFHLLNPLLSVALMIFFNKEYKFNLKDNLFGIIPTLLYSIVYLTMVVTGRWSDFYNFTFGGKFELIPIVIILMYSTSFLLGLIIRKLHNKLVIKNK